MDGNQKCRNISTDFGKKRAVYVIHLIELQRK